MPSFKFVAALIASASLATSPVLAQSANKLSVAQSVRAGSNVEGENLVGGSLIIALLAAAAVVAGVIVAADSDDDATSA